MKWYSESTAENTLMKPLKELKIGNQTISGYDYTKTFEQNLVRAMEELRKAGCNERVVHEYQAAVMNLALEYMRKKYDPSHADERQSERGDVALWRTTLKRLVPDVSLILLVGAGNGTEWVIEKKCIAIDVNGTALKENPQERKIETSANRLPLKEESIDCYVAFRTLQSTGVLYTQALAEARRVLKKAGTIIVSFPTIEYDRKKETVRKRASITCLEECTEMQLDISTQKFIQPFKQSFELLHAYRYISEDFLIGRK